MVRRALVALPAWLAVVAIVAAVAISLVSVTNPGVQDCGTPAAFLLDGRTNVYPDANAQVRRSDGRIETLTEAQYEQAFENPCSQRVADRMVPAGILFASGVALGVIVLLVSMVVWWRQTPPIADLDDGGDSHIATAEPAEPAESAALAEPGRT